MRILFLSHYFPPEVGAPQARIAEISRRLVLAGHEVTVLTAFPNYPGGRIFKGYRKRLYMQEEVDGVKIARSWVYATANKGSFHRILNQLSFAISSMVRALFLGGCDVVIVESPPLLLGASAYVISRLRRAPLLVNVADLWPASAVALGLLRGRIAVKLAETLEAFIYRKSLRVVGVTEGICKAITGQGVPFKKVIYLPNGVDTEVFRPGIGRDEARQQLGLGNEFAVIYAGTIGLAQGLDVAIEAAKLVAGHNIRFLLIGEGVEKDRLISKASAEGVNNIQFYSAQPRDLMPAIVNAADVFLVTLKGHPLFDGALPSKLLEAMACARPIILSARGEASRLIHEAKAGLNVSPGEPQLLAEAVFQAKDNPESTTAMGANGREFVQKHFERSDLANQFEDVISKTLNEYCSD